MSDRRVASLHDHVPANIFQADFFEPVIHLILEAVTLNVPVDPGR